MSDSDFTYAANCTCDSEFLADCKCDGYNEYGAKKDQENKTIELIGVTKEYATAAHFSVGVDDLETLSKLENGKLYKLIIEEVE